VPGSPNGRAIGVSPSRAPTAIRPVTMASLRLFLVAIGPSGIVYPLFRHVG